MKCTISIDGEKLKEYMGRKITDTEFVSFCEEAVLAKLWEEQITNLKELPQTGR